VRFVWRRDGGRCRVDGCRSSRGLEVHHIVHRADGGSHDPFNLAILCSACHLAHHRGALSITGTADRLEIHRPGQATPMLGAGGLPTRTPSTTQASAHVGAANETAPVAPARVHVGAAHGTAPVASARVHVGAANETARVAPARVHVGAASKLDAAILRTQAKAALVGLG
jgi:hypothetical protein